MVLFPLQGNHQLLTLNSKLILILNKYINSTVVLIVIIDYKTGNTGSIKNMLNKIGFDCVVSDNKDIISKASKLILSGVGSFDNGIKNLKHLDLIELIEKKVVEEKTPILGICLGMQLMAKKSEEGSESGFGWINQNVLKFKKNFSKDIYIPVMGWNYVSLSKAESKLFSNKKQRFYFVHSYYFPIDTPHSVAFIKSNLEYCCAFEKNNIFGVQFHPERSHAFGKELLKRFCNL